MQSEKPEPRAPRHSVTLKARLAVGNARLALLTKRMVTQTKRLEKWNLELDEIIRKNGWRRG